MKRIQHIFLLIISLLTVLSCADLLEGDYTSTEGKVTASISVSVPQLPQAHTQRHTRAMAMTPDVQDLYLAVFDNNGYLLEYVKATADKAILDNTAYDYTVDLTPTDTSTTIHFIGNGPETLHWGTEAEAIGGLYTEGGNEAYWERIYFPKGLRKDGEGFHQSVLDSLVNVRLARNFAWIKLQTGQDVDNFELQSYCVVNKRTRGSVAPYNTTTRVFEDFVHQQTYTDLVVKHRYEGFIPAGAQLDTELPDESEWFDATGVDTADYAYFIYEREKPTSDPTFIIMKGRYKPAGGDWLDTPSYYKVDLRDANGEYFPILRNFRYNIELTSILHEGHATAAAALAGAGSGDVSTSIETQTYTNISNNVARIFVSYTDTTLVNQTDELKLRYKFMVFETTDGEGNTTPERVLNGDENVTIVQGTPTAGGAVIDALTKAGSDDDNGWRELTIATTALEDFRKTQEIIIKGKVTIGEHTYSLQRKVTLNLRPKYDMQLVCAPTEVQQVTGTPFDVVIKVPGGMGQAMFPLEFKLEAAAQSMTPNLGDDLPVVTGKSMVPGKETKTTIAFIKHLEWDDYDALPNVGGYKSVPCHFKTTKAQSATAIYADNKYFNQASTTLKDYVASTFSNLAFNPTALPDEKNQPVSFKFTMSQMPSQGVVTLLLSNLAPDDDETRLTYQGVVGDKVAYSFNPKAINETSTAPLKLQNTDTEVEASVTLQAYHFTDAQAAMTYTKGTFTNRSFNPTALYNTVGQDVKYTFRMSRVPKQDVTVALTYLTPAAGSPLIFEKELNGVSYYKLPRPDNVDNAFELNLKNTAVGVEGKVQLSTLYFTDAENTLNIMYRIPSGRIKVGNRGDNITFYLYTYDPERNWSTGNNIANFKASNGGSNGSDIPIEPDEYQEIRANGGWVYVQYRTGNSGNRKYYVAKVLLDELLNGTAGNLDFNQK